MSKNRAGTKRVSTATARALVTDSRMWCAHGVVNEPEGQSHYLFDDDLGDVLVEVQLMPGGEQLLCRLGSFAGGADRGVWAIPPVGTEVLVAIPYGDFEAEPTIVSTLSTGPKPSELTDDTLLLVKREKVRIMSTDGDVVLDPSGKVYAGGDSGTQPAGLGTAIKNELEALRSKLNALIVTFNGHVHPVAGVATGSGAVTSAVTGTLETLASAIGTVEASKVEVK